MAFEGKRNFRFFNKHYHRADMTLGKYFIGQNFSEIANELTEISKAEYDILKPSFADEKIYHGKYTNFCEALWTTVIGVTQGKVNKISLKTPTTRFHHLIRERRFTGYFILISAVFF